MNQQGAPSFAYDIPSIHQKRPAIPAALGNLDLNRQVVAGDPLDYRRVTHAKSVAAALKGLRDSGDPLVTQEMVTISASRAVAIDSAYAASEFCPQDVGQMLQEINNHLGNIDNRLANIDNRLDNDLRNLVNDVWVVSARTANLRITALNRLLGRNALEPLQKTVAGYGRDLALPLTLPANLDQFNIDFPPGGNASLVGSTPPNFNANINSYLNINICKLIVFYRETFGIVPQDTLLIRKDKFRRYLSMI